MIMLQDGVRVFVLPDESHCIRDEESRSPIDLKECPCDHEVCKGDCDYYSEEKEAEIVIQVRNCDGVEVCYEYPTLEDLQIEWNKEHESPIIPMLDDQLLFGRVGETEVTGTTAEDVFRCLKETCGWNY